MSSDAVISVVNLSKAYAIWSSPSARLHGPILGQIGQMPFLPTRARDWCNRHSSQSFRNFYALKNISFTVRRGESIGIIGRNGSGKSTLLQLIAGTLTPTEGEVTVNGGVAALLELGSGFNPEFTGRENVYMNAAIRGMSKEETDAKFGEIVAFADIGDFIDQPTKTYSSGMLVRLAFAVSVCVEPELLIVDEALSVGDVFFQQKCFQRIHEMLDSGTTLLFVSHDTAAVQNLCNRAILLKEGASVFEGPPEEAVSRYYAQSGDKAVCSLSKHPGSKMLCDPGELAKLRSDIVANDILSQARSSHGHRELEIVGAAFVNEQGLHSMSVAVQETVTIHMLLRAHATIPSPTAGIHVYDRMNNLVFAAGTQQLRTSLSPIGASEERVVTLQLSLAVQPGEYTFSLGCAEASLDGPNVGYIQNRHEGLGPIIVHAKTDDTWPFYGIANLPMRILEWELE